jgi:hypothetical protein
MNLAQPKTKLIQRPTLSAAAATRNDKLAANYLAFVQLASIRL